MSALSDLIATAALMQNSAVANGNGTVLDVSTKASAVLQVIGTFTATVNFEGTADGDNYVAIAGQNLATGVSSTTVAAAGLYVFAVNALQFIRARISGWSANAVSVVGRASPMPLGTVMAAIPAGTALIGKTGIDQTTLGTTNGVSLVTDISEWSVTQASTANTEQTLTKAAGTGTTKHVITGFLVVLRGAAAGADISVALKDGSTIKWQDYFGSGAVRGERVGIVFAHGIEMTAATAANLYVGAGGASVVTEANMVGYTKAA
jgi:hypothetical protein